jgi:hypothetical protein
MPQVPEETVVTRRVILIKEKVIYIILRRQKQVEHQKVRPKAWNNH